MDFSTDTVPPIAEVLAAIYFYIGSWASWWHLMMHDG